MNKVICNYPTIYKQTLNFPTSFSCTAEDFSMTTFYKTKQAQSIAICVHHMMEDIQFPELSIPITITHKEIVNPAGPIPVNHGDTLYLSNLDDMIGCRVFTPTVYFYHSSESMSKHVVEKLRHALALVLVPYYPFAGRVRETDNGKLEIYFGADQGVLMVEAHTSSVALADLGDLSMPNPSWAPLIYKFPDEEPYKVIDMPLLIAQVTYFRDGGFSLGLRMCHCLCDGIGAMQFFNAWATTARVGSLVVSLEPCWDREYFLPRDPPVIKYPHIEYMSIIDESSLTRSLWEVKPVQKCYKVTREFQEQVKSLAQAQQTNQDGNYSTFDAMAAHVWRSWVKALDVKPSDFELRLTFTVNTRHMLKDPPLKEGFYGNAVCVACATSKVRELTDHPLPRTADLVHKARVSVNEDYLRSTIDYVEARRPKTLEFGGKLTITQWTRFLLYESADFGWGRPAYAGPIDLTPTPQVCVFLPEGGIHADGMLVCICLPETACKRFEELFCLLDKA